MMEPWHLMLYGIVSFLVSIVSGMAGVGAGFITTPFNIFLGLTPAQAVATGKFNGLSIAVGSLTGMSGTKEHVAKYRIAAVMLLAFVVGLLVPHIITGLEQGIYRTILGCFLLLMIPLMVVKKVGVQHGRPRLWQKYAGSALLAAALFLQGAFSGGLGALVNVVLMGMLGMTAAEANITKRWSQLVLNSTIILSVLGSGLIIWEVAVVGAVATLTGSYLGARYIRHRSNIFIMRILVGFMLVAGLYLIFGR